MGESLKAMLVNHLKHDRRFLRRMVQQVRYGSVSLQSAPVLFANSFPKSGTHLLTQILEGFTDIGPAVNSGLPAMVMFEGASGRERSMGEIEKELRVLANGDIAYGHLHARPEIIRFLASPRFATFFILRDPRDIVVSHVHYVTEMEPDHVHHDYYVNTLNTFEERLRTSILGRPDAPSPFPDIAGRFAPFLGWLDQPDIFVVKYEDLLHKRELIISQMVEFSKQRGFPFRCGHDEAVSALMSHINPQKSPTYRSGKTGGWRKAFTPEITNLFKETAGTLLIRLGYETTNDW
jgi:hypothetical protein